jgi:hypothetical protein
MMGQKIRVDYGQSPPTGLADQILVGLELFWSLPLILVGVLQIVDPFLIAVAIALGLIPWGYRGLVQRRWSSQAYITGPLLLLVVSGLVGVWASFDRTLSWPMWLTLLGSVNLFFAIVNTSVSTRWVAGGLVAAASLLALYFVGQYGHLEYPEEVGRLARLGRVVGSWLPNMVFFTPHPNAVAGFLESVFLLSLVLTWRSNGGQRVVWGLAALVIAYGLLLSGSRGAWIGLALALWIWAFLILNQRFRLVMGGLTLVGVVLGMAVLFQMTLDEQQNAILTSILRTADSRLILYRNSLYLLADYPFTGVGLGDAFAMAYSRYQLLIHVPFLYYAHNLFLSVGLGFGLLGFIALLWLFFNFYNFVIRVEKSGLSARSGPFFRAAWLGVTATFIHGLTDSPQFTGSGWTMPMLLAVLGFTIATGARVLAKNSRQSADNQRGMPWLFGRPFIIIGVGVVLAVMAGIFWQPLLGTWYANVGAIHQTRAELSTGLDDAAREAEARFAVDNFARALALNPLQPTANRRLGLMALNRDNFEVAVTYLEQAYPHEPENQATLKALGLAYLWAGQIEPAAALLRQRDDRGELVEELGYWSWWWDTQGRPDLSANAHQMVQQLAVEASQ